MIYQIQRDDFCRPSSQGNSVLYGIGSFGNVTRKMEDLRVERVVEFSSLAQELKCLAGLAIIEKHLAHIVIRLTIFGRK